jgi:hypothetical protein
MAGGWQEGKEEKVTETEGYVYKNEVILGAGPSIAKPFSQAVMKVILKRR